MQARLVLISFLIGLLCGCTGVSAVKPDGSGLPESLKSEQVSVVAFSGLPLKVMTPGEVMATTNATAKTSTEAIVTDAVTLVADALTRPVGAPAAVPDASYLIASSLRDLFKENLSLNVEAVSVSCAGEAPETELKAVGRYTLEVSTDVNLLAYRPLAWTTYQYMLQAHARLLAPDGTILWQSACQVAPMAPDPALQLDRHDFQFNDGQRLKDVMQVAADRCAKSMAPTKRS